MTDFYTAFERMILNEGGYTLHNDPVDRGGMTYAGISRKHWPNWEGWAELDAGREPDAETVRDFYRINFWQATQGDAINDQRIAMTIFDFAVNAGVRTAAILAQTVVGSTPDGKIGPKTLAALNAYDPDLFMARFALAKIARYVAIVTRDRSQQRFLLGWIVRVLNESA